MSNLPFSQSIGRSVHYLRRAFLAHLIHAHRFTRALPGISQETMRTLMFLLSTSLYLCSTSQTIHAANGRCGSQYGGALCDPQKGGTCCSLNGFCGDTAEYCLKSSGCQLNCTNDGNSTGTPTFTTTPTISQATATTGADAASSGQLTAQQRAGVIVGCVLGGCLLFCIMLWGWWHYKNKQGEQDVKRHEIDTGNPVNYNFLLTNPAEAARILNNEHLLEDITPNRRRIS